MGFEWGYYDGYDSGLYMGAMGDDGGVYSVWIIREGIGPAKR